jgi:repressor LexA
MTSSMDATSRPGAGGALTWRRRKIVTVIEQYLRDHDCSPSNREIADLAGLASTSSVNHHLRALKAAGIVSYDPKCPRTVRVLRPGQRGAGPADTVGHTSDGTGPKAGEVAGGAGLDKVVWVPIVGRIAAGGPILTQESWEGSLPLPREVVGREEGVFMLEVVGDSMIGVGIFPGDWVVIRPLFQQRPQNGDIVAATIEGVAELEGTVKTYKKVGRHVWLMPQNPAYTPIPGGRAKFAGKVVAVLRQV